MRDARTIGSCSVGKLPMIVYVRSIGHTCHKNDRRSISEQIVRNETANPKKKSGRFTYGTAPCVHAIKPLIGIGEELMVAKFNRNKQATKTADMASRKDDKDATVTSRKKKFLYVVSVYC